MPSLSNASWRRPYEQHADQAYKGAGRGAPRGRRRSGGRFSNRGFNAVINALPVRPATLQRMANWTIGVGLAAVIALAAHATGVTAKIHEEYAQAVGRAGFQVKKVEVVGADRIDRLKVYDIASCRKTARWPRSIWRMCATT